MQTECTVQAKAKQALHGIWQAETREEAEKAFEFLTTYESIRRQPCA